MLSRPQAWLAAFAVLVVLAVVLWRRVPTGFIPTEDKGYFAIAFQLPDAASLQRTGVVVQRVEGFLHERAGGPEHCGVRRARRAHPDQPDQQRDDLHQLLLPWDERGRDESIEAITERINGKLFGMKDAIGFAFNLPEIPGLGATSGVEANLQNRAGKDVRDFALQVQAFVQSVNKLPAVQAMNTNFRANVPQLYVNVDRVHRQGARSEPHRPVRHAADVPVHPLHQRLQPLRPDLSSAGGSPGALPAVAGGSGRLYVQDATTR